jgi:hypothetical protein
MASTRGRLVRQDGTASDVEVSHYSLRGCCIPDELPLGELVSVEFTDTALLVGRVCSSQVGKSQIIFTGIAG